MYSFCAMNSFRMSFWIVPDSRLPVCSLLFRDGEIHREQHRRRRVDRHRGGDVRERDPVEQPLHVGERHDAHAALPDLAERELVVGISSHQRRKVEGDAEPGAASGEQRLVALVGLLGRAEPRELPHRPQLAAVAGRMDAADVGKFARIVELALVVEPGEVVGRVEARDGAAGDGRERHVALGRALQRRLEHFTLPPLPLRFGGHAFHTSSHYRRTAGIRDTHLAVSC